MTVTMSSIQQYLDKNYDTLAQLAERAQVSEETILLYINTQCVPPHSFEVSSAMLITSGLLNDSVYHHPIRYYHPSLAKWIAQAVTLSEQYSLSEVANKVRQAFNEKYTALIGDKATPGCEDLDSAWSYLMMGIWGICLKDICVDNIAKKELSRLAIANLVESKTDSHLTSEEKMQLIAAIDDYEEVVAEFAPHLVPISSRLLEIEQAKALFLNENGI